MSASSEDKLNERLEEILRLNLKLTKACDKDTGKIAGDIKQLDVILKGLQSVSDELDAKTTFIDERTKRLNKIVDILLDYTVMNFSRQIDISDAGDEVDAVALGLNTLGEELNSHISQLNERTEDLTRSNKQLEEFVYIASHDLQEPLKTLTNYTNLLRDDLQNSLDENSSRYIAKLTSATERMRLLIIDLLEYARVGQQRALTIVDCNVLIDDVLGDMAASIQDSKAIVSFKQLPSIKGNYPELKSLFQNLLSNAIKFKKPDVEPVITISATAQETDWVFAVEDNGIGIEERFHDRIFSIFQKLHSRKLYQGTGIGLAHCKKVVEHHRGRIWLRSVVGKGSTFYFTIPKTK